MKALYKFFMLYWFLSLLFCAGVQLKQEDLLLFILMGGWQGVNYIIYDFFFKDKGLD